MSSKVPQVAASAKSIPSRGPSSNTPLLLEPRTRNRSIGEVSGSGWSPDQTAPFSPKGSSVGHGSGVAAVGSIVSDPVGPPRVNARNPTVCICRRPLWAAHEPSVSVQAVRRIILVCRHFMCLWAGYRSRVRQRFTLVAVACGSVLCRAGEFTAVGAVDVRGSQPPEPPVGGPAAVEAVAAVLVDVRVAHRGDVRPSGRADRMMFAFEPVDDRGLIAGAPAGDAVHDQREAECGELVLLAA